VTFADLIAIYRATRFDGDKSGMLTVVNEHMAVTLRAIMDDDVLYNDAQISLEGEEELVVGSEVRISVGPPNSAKMGLLVATFDDLFRSPRAVFVEPEPYYVKDPGYASGDQPVPEVLERYRAVLSVLPILRKAPRFLMRPCGSSSFWVRKR
jgi:hypothetical protein